MDSLSSRFITNEKALKAHTPFSPLKISPNSLTQGEKPDQNYRMYQK